MRTLLFKGIPVSTFFLLLLLMGEMVPKRPSDHALLPGQTHLQLVRVQKLTDHLTALPQPHFRPPIILASLRPIVLDTPHATSQSFAAHASADLTTAVQFYPDVLTTSMCSRVGVLPPGEAGHGSAFSLSPHQTPWRSALSPFPLACQAILHEGFSSPSQWPTKESEYGTMLCSRRSARPRWAALR